MDSLPADSYKTIYHEMGHLQDFYKNLPEIHIKQENPFKGFWKDFKQSMKTGKHKPDRAGVEEIDNRWGGTTYKGYEKLLKDEPEKFKKLYPDLYEHLTNPEIQSTAGEISEYAQTSIGEFIADTYAWIVSGKKVPDKVMDLYKKYGGPGVG